jgi:hypothetical protein
MVQRKKRANRWHVIESDGSIFGKVFFEVIGELSLAKIAICVSNQADEGAFDVA